MSDKAVLVMDMTEDCDKCKIRAIGLAWCNVARKSTSHYANGKPIDERKRPGWCPMKAMPGKLADTPEGVYDTGYLDGWNACIDAILEGCENEQIN